MLVAVVVVLLLVAVVVVVVLLVVLLLPIAVVFAVALLVVLQLAAVVVSVLPFAVLVVVVPLAVLLLAFAVAEALLVVVGAPPLGRGGRGAKHQGRSGMRLAGGPAVSASSTSARSGSSSPAAPPRARKPSPVRVAMRASCAAALRNPHQRLVHASSAERRRSAGAARAFCLASMRTSWKESRPQRPPTSQERTMRRPDWPVVSSRYLRFLRCSATRRAAPSVSWVRGRCPPSLRRGGTMVLSQHEGIPLGELP